MKRLNEILSVFTKVVADLNVLIDENSSSILNNEYKIKDLQETNTDLDREKRKAEKVAKKLEKLLS